MSTDQRAQETAETRPRAGDTDALDMDAQDMLITVRRNPRLTPAWTVAVAALTVAGILLAMNQVFFWNLGGLAVLTNAFLYLLLACFVPIVFIMWPIKDRGRAEHQQPAEPGVPWYDVGIIGVFTACCLYLAYHGEDIQEFGWEFVAPMPATVVSFLLWGVVLEALRRSAGWIVAVLALAFSLYPMVAEGIPAGLLQGISYDLTTLAQIHAMGAESILGLPLQTAGSILVGFLLFGVVLQHTGGADFFHSLSMALFGQYRGGSAKVTVASSASMGMMSGSAVSNVLTTGPMTIPAMKRSGFSARMAGGVEATASSGGSITPPIMGTAAFLMVSFLGVAYTEVLIAAAIPAVLYFLGIFIQIDGYAAQRGLTGTARDKLPRLGASLLAGWPYLGALALLTLMLFTSGSESQVPYWVVGLLLVIAFIKPGVRFGPRQWLAMVLDIGRTLGQIVAIIAGVGLFLGGLSATGVALSLSRDLVALVGDNLLLILIASAIVCFILGMGLTISAAYVFLAIVMVPAVTALGVDPIAAHLFVIYWASVSYITPPVGLAAFAAAGIAKSRPMATCLSAMKLGAVKYVVPFGFVLNPALVAQASLGEVLLAFAASLVAVYALACAISGWLLGVERQLPILLRIPLAIGGFLLFLTTSGWTLLGLLIVAGVVGIAYATRSRAPAAGRNGSDVDETADETAEKNTSETMEEAR